MIPQEFVKRFFMFVIVPRALWRIFVGAIFITLVAEIEATATKQFIMVLGIGIILGAVYGFQKAFKVLFAKSEQVNQSVK